MPFPTTGILDAFTRADEDPLGNGTWTGPFRETGGQLKIVSNVILGQATSQNNSSYWSAADFGPDCEVFHDVSTVDADISPSLRISSPGASVNCYIISENGGTWQLYKEVGGAFTALGSSASQTVSAGDGIGLSAVGTTITMWYRAGAGAWATIGTPQTDSSVTGAGKIGTCANFNQTYDNFGGGTVATPELWMPALQTSATVWGKRYV